METPCLRVDFNNADVSGRIRLNTVGTEDDLATSGLTLANGLEVSLIDCELSASAVVRWSHEEELWVAEVTSDITEAGL